MVQNIHLYSKCSYIYTHYGSWTLAGHINVADYPEAIEHLCYGKPTYREEFLLTEHLAGQKKNSQGLKRRAIARKGSMRRYKNIKVKINTLFYSFNFCLDL